MVNIQLSQINKLNPYRRRQNNSPCYKILSFKEIQFNSKRATRFRASLAKAASERFECGSGSSGDRDTAYAWRKKGEQTTHSPAENLFGELKTKKSIKVGGAVVAKETYVRRVENDVCLKYSVN